MTVQPMLIGLETLCVSCLMYYDVADRVLEHAVLSNYVGQRVVFLVAQNNTCRHNVLPAAVTNIPMMADDGAADADWSRDALCVMFDVL
jgi:hypothetical protein